MIVLYDGVCGLCDEGVQRLLDLDREGLFRYAALQGETAAELRERFPELPSDLSTMGFVEGDRLYLRSRAILRILSHLPAPWRWLSVLSLLPAALTDLGYRLVAGSRYRIWGSLEACRLPEPEVAARFLP